MKLALENRVRSAALAMMCGCLAAIPLISAGVHAAPSDAGPITLDDIVTRERSIDDAALSPDDRYLVFTTAAEGGPSHGTSLTWVTHDTTTIVDLDTLKRIVIGNDGEPHYAMQPCNAWAPSGSGFAINVLSHGAMLFGYYDIARRRAVTFPFKTAEACSSWAGAKLVYLSMPADVAQFWVGQQILASVSSAWSRTWSTGHADATVSSNNALFPATPPSNRNLIVADPASGTASVLAKGRFGTDIFPSPDGRFVAAVKEAEPLADGYDLYLAHRSELEIFDVGKPGAPPVRTVAGFDVARSAIAWSPDSRHVLIGGKDTRTSAEAMLLVVDVDGPGQHALSVPEGWSLSEYHAIGSDSPLNPIGWISAHPAAILARPDDNAAAKADGTPTAALSYDYGADKLQRRHLFAFNDGAATDLSAFAIGSTTAFLPTVDGGAVSVTDGALWKVSLASKAERLTQPDLIVSGFAREASEQVRTPGRPVVPQDRVAIGAVDAHGVPVRAVVDTATGRILLSSSLANNAANSRDQSTVAEIKREGWSQSLSVAGAHNGVIATLNESWKNRPVSDVREFSYVVNGRKLLGWVVLPPGYKSGRLPAIAWLYGGQVFGKSAPRAAQPGAGPTAVFNGQLLAAQGYAVIYPSTPVGRGETTDMLAALADDTVAAIDGASAAGYVDPARVGLIGQSFGGFSVAAVLAKRSDRFKAGVSLDGVYDMNASWGQRAQSDLLIDHSGQEFVLETRGFMEEGQAGLGVPFWKNPDAYHRNSPINFVDKMDAPILLIQGDLDLGVTSLSSGERFYAALKRENKHPVLVRYWGEGHVQTDEGVIRDEWQKITTWFDRYLNH